MQTKQKLRYATIGTGKITERFLQAATFVSQVELYAIHSRNETRAKQFKEKYKATIYYTDIHDLIRDKNIDFIYIATPNIFHFEHIKLCIQHGKHVLCEKPLVTNKRELREAYELADKYGVILLEAMRHLYNPNIEKLVQSLKHIGNIHSSYLHRVRYSSRYDEYKAGNIPQIMSASHAGGALMDLGVYPLYLALYLFGRPIKTSYHATKLDSDVDLNGTLLLHYESFLCTIMCSKIGTSYNKSEFHGDYGSITVDDVATMNKVHLIKNNLQQQVINTDPSPHDMVYELKTFISFVHGEQQLLYKKMSNISKIAIEILDQSRFENNIIFPSDT